MKKFIIECVLFRSKEELHRILGIFCWLNVLQAVIAICGIVKEFLKV